MGSGAEEHAELAEPLGEAIAHLGAHLLTGGGSGTMRAVARGFTRVCPRPGVSIGILRGESDGSTMSGDPNEFVEIPIRTHLPHSGTRGCEPTSRNHLNTLTPDAIVALPGGPGTGSEIELALRYRTPILVHAVWSEAFPSLARWNEVPECVAWLHDLRVGGEPR